ncbi:cingulin-like [Alligator mississippiensis]|uniref:cingulin-like n=1 Tax=Alligator mississippiensis TaxID=8496 RepID=UPI0028775E73|nr:cingulin-like [Alligator mississippiensis]
MAHYEELRDRNMALEKELEAGTKETNRLQSLFQRVEAEKDHLGEQVQCLKNLLEDSVAKEAETNNEREQALLQRQVLEQQIQVLEAENKTLQATNNQIAAKGQDSGESVEMEVTSIVTQTEAGLKDQLGEEIWSLKTLLKESTARELALRERIKQQSVQTAQIQSRELITINSRLEEHASKIKAGYEEHLMKYKGLKEILINTEKLVKTGQPMLLKALENQEPSRTKGLEIPREEEETEQQERTARMEALVGFTPERAKEEITITVMECLNQRWGQWVNQYTEEMNGLREKLEKLAGSCDAGRLTAPKQGQQREVDQRPKMAQARAYNKQGIASKGERVAEALSKRKVQGPETERRGQNPRETKGGGGGGLKLHPKGEVSSPAQKQRLNRIQTAGQAKETNGPSTTQDIQLEKEQRGRRRPCVYINDIARRVKWWTLREVIEAKVGGVAYVKIYKGLMGRPTSQAKVEFWREEYAQKALERQWEIWRRLQGLQKILEKQETRQPAWRKRPGYVGVEDRRARSEREKKPRKTGGSLTDRDCNLPRSASVGGLPAAGQLP